MFAVTGCIDSPQEAAELLDEAPIEERVGRAPNPTITRCNAPADPLLETEWVWGANGMPIGVQVELVDPVDELTVEFQVLDGAAVDTLEIQRTEAQGTQVFDLSMKTLEEAADLAAEGGALFGSVSAVVTARDAAGAVVAAGDASTVHFKRDSRGALTGFTPSEAAAAPELRNAYPDAVLIEGVDPANTYVRVYRSNPGK